MRPSLCAAPRRSPSLSPFPHLVATRQQAQQAAPASASPRGRPGEPLDGWQGAAVVRIGASIAADPGQRFRQLAQAQVECQGGGAVWARRVPAHVTDGRGGAGRGVP